MAVKPVTDHGQELPPAKGHAIGFVDTKAQFDAVTQALKAAGYADSSIIALFGEDGIDLLERQKRIFNFGDGEDAIVRFSIGELRAGHYAMGIETADRDEALRIVNLTKPLGLHSFNYFGKWFNERLTR